MSMGHFMNFWRVAMIVFTCFLLLSVATFLLVAYTFISGTLALMKLAANFKHFPAMTATIKVFYVLVYSF